MSCATTVWLPVPAMPLACQSSSRDSSLALTMTHIGIASAPEPRTALTMVQFEPWPPVLNPHRPDTR